MLGSRPWLASSSDRTPNRMLAAARAGIIVVGLAVAAVVYVVLLTTNVPYDGWTYLAAGERLNAGHELYRLVPGDRPVDLKPPYWTVPLLSPPLIAVVWRPLALLPGDLGLQVWWTATTIALAGALLALSARRPIPTLAMAAALAFPLLTELYVGNVNPLLLVGLIGIWLLVRAARDRTAGAILAIFVALKVTPIVLVWWFVVHDRRQALIGFAAGSAAALAVSVAGAGVSAHLAYLEVVRETTTVGQSAMSLPGLARAAGLPDLVATAIGIGVVVAGGAAAVVLRNHAGVTFAILVATMVVASPVVTPGSLTLLFAGLAPLAWPAARPTSLRAGPGRESATAPV